MRNDDLLTLAYLVNGLGMMIEGETLYIHAGPYDIGSRRTPKSARIFHGHPGAYVDHEAARRAIEEIDEILERLDLHQTEQS